MANAFARSFLFHHPSGDIALQIVTDRPELLAPDVSSRATVTAISPGELGEGFAPKLQADRLTQSKRTLCLDADCLVYRHLGGVFDAFRGSPVGLIGPMTNEGDLGGPIAPRCERFGVRAVPRHIGSVSYFEAGEDAAAIFDRARGFLDLPDEELFIRRHRGHVPDDALMSLAVALHGLESLPEDGTIRAEPNMFATRISVSVLRGRARLENTPDHRDYCADCPHHVSEPAIVHFKNVFSRRPEYRAEMAALSLHARGFPPPVAAAIAAGAIRLPLQARDGLKNALRPAYRALFGVRKPPPCERLAVRGEAGRSG